MAQDKRIFTGGMDKDSEPRLIKNGDYRHAENIRNVASSDGTSGSVENIEGTKEVIHNFPGAEVNQITTNDESGFITDVEPASVLYSQKIILIGKEVPGKAYNFTILNHTDSMGSLAPEGITLTWTGNEDGTKTTEYLFSLFGPGGSLSENITIINKNTGDLSTAHINQESLNFTNGVPSMFTGANILEVEIIADNPGIDFELNFYSSYSAEVNQLWSSTIDTLHPNGHLFIQNEGRMILTSNYDFGITDVVNDSTNEDGSPIGDFPGSTEGVTQIMLEFEGVEPTTPEDVTGTTIFSYNENADGSFNVLPFVEIGAGLFDSGDDYEFDASQNNIAEALVDKFTNFEAPVLETSLGQQVLLKSKSNIITGFNKNTRLSSINPESSEAEEADSSFYYLLNNYVSTNDLHPLVPPSEATLEGNVYSIAGRGVTAGKEFFFPANIVKGKSYRIQGTLTTMVASNSILFNLGKLISQPFSTQGDSIECTFTANENLNKFSFEVENAFATDTDKIKITGLTISEYQAPNSKLQVLIQGSSRYDFNLCFGVSEEQVKEDLEKGFIPELDIKNFIAGAVGARFTTYNSTGTGYNDDTNPLVLIQLIESLTASIANLEAQITNLNLDHADALSDLNDQLAADSAQAAADLADLQAKLSALTAAHSALQADLDETTIALDEALADADIDAETIVNLNSQITDLQLQVENLQEAVANAVGSNLITNGGFDNDALDGSQGWSRVLPAAEDEVFVETNQLVLDKPGMPADTSFLGVSALTSGGSTSIVENGSNYRLSFDIISIAKPDGSEIPTELQYYNGTSYVSLGKDFTTESSVIEHYTASGTHLQIGHTTPSAKVIIDNVVLEEISAASIADFIDLETQLEAANDATADAEDALNTANNNLSTADVNWAAAYNNILSTLTTLLGTTSSTVTGLEGVTLTNTGLQDSISDITTELNDIISNTTTLADSIGVNYTQELTISGTLSSLNSGVTGLTSLVDTLINGLPEYETQSSADLNTAVALYKTAAQNALAAVNESLTAAEALNDELTAEVDAANAAAQAANAATDEANTALANVEVLLAAALIHDDGVTQADVDAVQDLLDAVVEEDGITQATVDAAVAAIDVEDGVSQADVDTAVTLIQLDVDAVQALLDAANDELSAAQDENESLQGIIEANTTLISSLEGQAANLNGVIDDLTSILTLGDNVILNGDFKDETTSWGNVGAWSVIDEQLCRPVDAINEHNPYNSFLSGNETLLPGEYILSIDVGRHPTDDAFEGGFDLRLQDFASSGNSITIGSINSVETNQTFTFNIPDNGTQYNTLWFISPSSFVGSVDNVSLQSYSIVGGGAVSQEDYDALVAANEDLQALNDSLAPTMEGLNQDIADLTSANEHLVSDVALLWAYMNDLVGSVSLSQAVTDDISLELSGMANITQVSIDTFVGSFNNVINSLNDQISTLTESLDNATAGVTSTFSLDSSDQNDRYRFTYVGNIPDLQSNSNGNKFKSSYTDNYNWGVTLKNQALSRINSEFPTVEYPTGSAVISNPDNPGLVTITGTSAMAGMFYSSGYGFGSSYSKLVGGSSLDDGTLSPDFAFIKDPDSDSVIAYKYNFTSNEFEAYKITYLTGDDFLNSNTSNVAVYSPNIGEAGVALDSANVSTWLESQNFTSGTETKTGITHGTQVEIEILSGPTTGFYLHNSKEIVNENDLIVGPDNSSNAVYTLADFPEVEDPNICSVIVSDLSSGSTYPLADNGVQLRRFRIDCFVEFIAGATRQASPPPPEGGRTHEGATRRMFKSFSTGATTTTSIDSSDFNWKCVGTYEDKPKSRVYYFVCSDDVDGKKQDCILEYDLLRNSVVTVYQDGRPSTSGNHNNILNFDQEFLITGINKVDDILYWTDNLNRPRKINVELSKANEVNIKNATSFQDVYYKNNQSSVFIGVSDNHGFEVGDHIYTQINQSTYYPGTEGNNGYTRVTGVIPKLNAGVTLKVTNADPAVAVYDSEGNLTDDFGDLSAGQFIGIEEMVSGTSTNFSYYYEVESVSGSTITLTTPYNQTTTSSAPFANPLQNPSNLNVGGLITECPWAGTFTALPGKILHVNPKGAYSPLVSFGDTIEKAKYLDAVRHQPTHKPVTTLNLNLDYATNNILDNVFQFKYRYLHADEEATSYSPISDVFIDSEFALNSMVNANNYGSMSNRINVIYDNATPDVDTIEIVARKGNDGPFFLVDTLQNNFIKYLKRLKNEVIASSEYDYTDLDSVLSFYNNGTYPFIDKADSNKLYDAVPKKAKAQTILSNNRLAYGNIIEGYDNTKMVVKSNFTHEGAVTLTSESVDIPLLNENIDAMLGPNSSDDKPFGGDSILIVGPSTSNENTIHNPKFNLNDLGLAADINQTININYSWSLFHNPSAPFTPTIHRNGSYSTGAIDITSYTTIDSVGLFLEAFINTGGGSLGEFSGTGYNSHHATYNLLTKNLEIEFTFNDNEGVGYSTFELVDDAFSFVNNSKFTQGEGGLSSFKTGAFHNFGVAYFDETNRCSFVNAAPDYGFVQVDNPLTGGEDLYGVNYNGTRPYNKFYSEVGGPDLSESSSVNFKIYNRPPKWATHYQMYYTGNNTVDEFIQMTVVNAKKAEDATDTQVYLSLQSLKGEGWSYNESNNSQIGYNFVAGDRVRFISYDPGTGREKFKEYVDLEIAGDDLYSGEDGDPFPSTDEVDSGYYIRINDPINTAVEVSGGGNVDISHAGIASGIDGTGYENLIVEIYRPKKDLEEDLMVYYEIGDKYPIISVGEANRSHSGDGNQVNDFIFNKDLGLEISTTPATINIKSGDIYLKPRVMATSTDGDETEIFFPEDYYLNDFHRTNHYSRGRINVINNNAAERHLEASVYYSEQYSSTGSINGLSNFNLANTPYYDYNKNFGSIQSLMMRDDSLLIFHENKVGRVLVQKDVLMTASGEGLVSLSNKVIDNYVTLYSGEYGCCLQPESIVKFGNKFYFVDIKRGTVLRLSNDGLTDISSNGMRDYFRDLGEMYVINDPENQEENVFNIVAGYDPKYDEYIVTFPDVYERDSESWEGGRTFWDSDYETYRNKSSRSIKIFNSKTISFDERTNKWTSFYDFYPEYYARVGRQFVGFKNGRLYKHNMTDRGYQNLHTAPGSDFEASYNYLYETQYNSTIQFPFNAEPSSVKSYNAISLESDYKFFTSMYTNTGQTVSGGGLLGMGYDTTTGTEIGYRKVEGLINNYSSEIGNETLIKGVGTKFFEDVRRGDTVRIFGINPSGHYTYATLIVVYVVSNEILRLDSWTGLNLEDSYMEVIDYKTKEGVQYAQIPFVKSDIQGNITAAITEDHGDGSEFFGIGFGTENLLGESIGSFSATSIGLNIISIQKQIAPKDMIVGAEYVVYQIETTDILGAFSIGDEASPGYETTEIGSVFTCKNNATSNYGKVLSTDCKLYLQKQDGETVFLGYPYISGKGNVSYIKSFGYDGLGGSSDDSVFLFIVKDGNVEGEKMKGQYMMTTLTTDHLGAAYTSRYKFNLYAANADVDKSELSNK